MANDEDLDLSGNEGEDAKIEGGGSKKKLIIIIAAAVVLLGGGAGAFFMMGGDDTKEKVTKAPEEKTAEVEAAPETVKKAAIYVSIPNGILAQIPSGKSRRRMTTVQIQVDFLVRDTDVQEALMKHMPLIENDLLVYISSAKLEELESVEGKKKTRAGVLKIVQKIMQEKIGKPGVEKVLFSGFVMQ